MKVSVGVLLLAVLVPACARETSVSPDPEWLTSLIQTLESQPVANPPAFIARYDYRGETVYYLPPRCCDIPSIVFSATGTIICHADGGISGGGDGRCSDFLSARENEQVVWRDS